MVAHHHGVRVARWEASTAGKENGDSVTEGPASSACFDGVLVLGADSGADGKGSSPPTSTPPVGTSPDENDRPFGAWGADRMMMKAFGRVCGLRVFTSRDYQLLELIVPELKGAFDFRASVTGGRTLGNVRGSSSPAELDPRPILQTQERLELMGVEKAVSYLGGSNSMLAMHNMLAAARIPGNNFLTALVAIPFELSALMSGGAFDPCVRGLRAIYRVGVNNLRNDPAICVAVRAFLQAEKGGTQRN